MIFFEKNSKNYCFIHNPKTAGTSLQKTILEKGIGNSKYNSIFNKYMDEHNCKHNHTPFYFINSFFLKKFNLDKTINYLTIVRNPWDRFASLFEQELLRDVVGLSKKNSLKKDLRSYLNKNYETLTETLLEELDFYSPKKRKELFKFWLFYLGLNRKILPLLNPNFNILPQSWWFVDEIDGKIIKNIFLFEDLKLLEDKFDITLSHENKKKTKFNYADYYEQETIDYVYQLDKYVINNFGYQF